jgi:signal transduction histidine kinase
MKAVDLHEGIDSTLMILQNRLKAKGDRRAIEIVKNYGDLPAVECYGGQLNQVFMNLLSNAIDALEDWQKTSDFKTPKIQIQTELADDRSIQICISDNGTGIPEKARSQLFDPFFTTKPPGKGTGLGLSIAYQIVVEKHQGSLECYSQIGEGTEFLIKIPIQASREAKDA